MEKACHRYKCEISFSDTDASGWMHFSRVLVFAERAEHDFVKNAGIGGFESGGGGWPRVRAVCDHNRTPRCQDAIEVEIDIREIGKTSLTWQFEFENDGGKMAATGELVGVKVDESGAVSCVTVAEKELLDITI